MNSIESLSEKIIPNLLAVISLIEEHPDVAKSGTLSAAMSLIRQSVENIWEDVDLRLPGRGRDSTMSNLNSDDGHGAKQHSVSRVDASDNATAESG